MTSRHRRIAISRSDELRGEALYMSKKVSDSGILRSGLSFTSADTTSGTMAKELNGWARARPIRIAFIVEKGEHEALCLDGIFADSFWRWGGRFSLIVPAAGGDISNAYWRWLEAFDPDIVYSYVALSRETILEIHERIYPAKYLHHQLAVPPRLDTQGFRPSYHLGALSSLSAVFKLARYAQRPDVGPVSILDSWFTERPTRFFMDNFGAYFVSRGGSLFPADARTAASLLSVVTPEHAQNRHNIPEGLRTVPSEIAAWEEFANRRATSLSLLSATFAPKLNVNASPWGSAFNLVVGDTFDDRLLYWNARLLTPEWLDSEISCFRVSFDQLKDEESRRVLTLLLRNRNFVNGGGGGQPQLAVRSASLNEQDLAEAEKLVRSLGLWGPVRSERIETLDALVPTERQFEHAQESMRYLDNALPRSDWRPFSWSGDKIRPPAVAPAHLSDAPPAQSFASGAWTIDYIFEADGPRPRFGNANQWMLPKRWRMAGAIKVEIANDGGAYGNPLIRRSREGKFAALISSDHPVGLIKLPTPLEALHHAFVADGAWAQADGQNDQALPLARVRWMERSNEANHLAGVLGLAGGLPRASSFLLHPFLQDMFAVLGGTPNLPVEKARNTAVRVRNRAQREPAFDLKDENEQDALTDLIVKAARDLPSSLPFVRLEDLRTQWDDFRQSHLQAQAWDHLQPEEREVYEREEQRSLDSVLIEMRRLQMVFQGHQWRCENCHHKNWADLSSLSPSMACEVCHRPTNAPISIDWLFRANEFLIESLRSHSVLSLIWVLTAFRERARQSFLWGSPAKFGFSDSPKADAEADLMIIRDGKTYLCEVKSSWRFRLADLDKLVRLSELLRPDCAVFAVMAKGSKRADALNAARNRLAAAKIELEILTLDKFAAENNTWLSYEAQDAD